MVQTDLSLHFAVIYNLGTGKFDALQPEKAGEIHHAALDIRTPEAELERRLFHCTQWNSRGRTQLQNTFGLAQLLSDNPASVDFTKTALQKYYAAMKEFGDDPEKVRQINELLIDDERSWSLRPIETPKPGRTRRVDMSEQLVRTLRRLKIDRMVEKGEARMARDAALIFF